MDTDTPSDPSLDPIGVFHSGIGGLTVAAALKNLLPSEAILYIGDTARVPYGGKSRRTVERYSIEIGGLLLAEQAKIIVVACNTASALAVPRMKELFKVPVQGVVTPGAERAQQSPAEPMNAPSTLSIEKRRFSVRRARFWCHLSKRECLTIRSPIK
jgi:glutamate racemase